MYVKLFPRVPYPILYRLGVYKCGVTYHYTYMYCVTLCVNFYRFYTLKYNTHKMVLSLRRVTVDRLSSFIGGVLWLCGAGRRLEGFRLPYLLRCWMYGLGPPTTPTKSVPRVSHFSGMPCILFPFYLTKCLTNLTLQLLLRVFLVLVSVQKLF